MISPTSFRVRLGALVLLLAISSSAHAGLLWEDTVSGGGPDGQASSVVTDGTRVHVAGFVTTEVSEDALVRTYEPATGALLWEARFAPGSELGRLALDDGRLFATAFASRGIASGGQEWAVVAWDAADGVELWRDVRDDGPFGHAAELAATGGRLFVAGTGSTAASSTAFVVRATDAANGATLWEQSPGHAGPDAAYGLAVGDGMVLAAGPVDGHVHLVAYSQQDGRELWSAAGPELPFAARVGGVALAAGRVLIAADLNDALLLQAHDAATGEILWQQSITTVDPRHPAWELSALALAADEREVVTGYWFGAQQLAAWDAATGAPLWRNADVQAIHDPQLADGTLWAVGGAPAFVVRALDASSGRGVWASAFIPLERSSLALARSGTLLFVAGTAGPGAGTFAVTALDASVPANVRPIAPRAGRLPTTR